MSVSANFFPVQCSVIASAALTRDRGLHFLPRKKKLNTFFNAIDCYIVLKRVYLSKTRTGKQYQYLKHGDDNPVANKKMTLGQVVTNFTGQMVASFVYVCVCVFVCLCVLQHHSRIHHTLLESMDLYVYIKRKCLSFL